MVENEQNSLFSIGQEITIESRSAWRLVAILISMAVLFGVVFKVVAKR